ncbi:MAG TPA: lactate utilization protein [Sunxiuqinia sp.]|nr:lactate utilization protein [Sunxiuqinia sp.]
MGSSRENILKRLQEAKDKRGDRKMVRPDFSSAIYHAPSKKLTDSFQANLELVGGTVIRVKNLSKAVAELKKLVISEKLGNIVCLEPVLQEALKSQVDFQSSMGDLQHVDVGITSCEFLVAHLGSILVSSAGSSGRRMNVFQETHLIVAHKSQVVSYLDDALIELEKKYPNRLPSSITNITGPSRTADIEKTLVMGMHGPKKLFVLLTDEPF